MSPIWAADSPRTSSSPAVTLEIVIGVIYPMTGQLAQLGIDSVTAMKMATELYNSKSDLNLLPALAGLPRIALTRRPFPPISNRSVSPARSATRWSRWG